MPDSICVCPHKQFCSGCSPETSCDRLIIQANRFFASYGQSDYTVIRGADRGWRTRAKLAVRRQRSEALAIGLFAQNSHDVVPIPHCIAHHPQINVAVSCLSTWPAHLGYDERSGTGQLRYIQTVVERATNRVQLTLVLALPSFDHPAIKAWEERARVLFDDNPSLWHSVWLNLQPHPVNTIFGPQWRHVCGEKFVRKRICDCALPSLPSDFCQANLEMFERLLQDLRERIPRGANVVELYAGMGVISSAIASRMPFSHCCGEGRPFAEDSFQLAKSGLPSDLRARIQYVVQDAGAAELDGATTVIVDPPRKGLSSQVIQAIAGAKTVRRVLYISCSFPTLERDICELMRATPFVLSFAHSYLFFPGTDTSRRSWNLLNQEKIWVRGFEPPTSCTPCKCASQAALHPDQKKNNSITGAKVCRQGSRHRNTEDCASNK